MLILCYLSSAVVSTQEQLWSVTSSRGWISASAVPGNNFFFIPEDLVTWCLLIDPGLTRCESRDYMH